MCLLEPITPIVIIPNALSPGETDQNPGNNHFERLLATATIISTMGNIHSSVHPLVVSSPGRSDGLHINGGDSPTGRRSPANQAIRQFCSLTTFILGGPMPPSPGLVPLCWEELVDWTDDATSLTEIIHHQSSILNSTSSNGSKRNGILRGIQFVPYLSVYEREDALKKLASRTYMQRVQFYQESVGHFCRKE